MHERHDDLPQVLTLGRLPRNQVLIEYYQFDGCLNLRRIPAEEIAALSIPAQTSSRPVNGYELIDDKFPKRKVHRDEPGGGRFISRGAVTSQSSR